MPSRQKNVSVQKKNIFESKENCQLNEKEIQKKSDWKSWSSSVQRRKTGSRSNGNISNCDLAVKQSHFWNCDEVLLSLKLYRTIFNNIVQMKLNVGMHGVTPSTHYRLISITRLCVCVYERERRVLSMCFMCVCVCGRVSVCMGG